MLKRLIRRLFIRSHPDLIIVTKEEYIQSTKLKKIYNNIESRMHTSILQLEIELAHENNIPEMKNIIKGIDQRKGVIYTVKQLRNTI